MRIRDYSIGILNNDKKINLTSMVIPNFKLKTVFLFILASSVAAISLVNGNGLSFEGHICRRARTPSHGHIIKPRQLIQPQHIPEVEIPDGASGLRTMQMGFSGNWQLNLSLSSLASNGVENGTALRFLKSLSVVAYEVASGKLGIKSDGIILDNPATIKFGAVYVIDNISDLRKTGDNGYFLVSLEGSRSLCFEITQVGQDIVVTTFVLTRFLKASSDSPMEIGPWQQRLIRDTLSSGNISHKDGVSPVLGGVVTGGRPGIDRARVLIMHSGAAPDDAINRSRYEEGILREDLMRAGTRVFGFTTTPDSIIRNDHADDLRIDKIRADNPNIIIIHMSQYDYAPSRIAERIKQIRDARIDAYIVIEGLGTSVAPEQNIVLTDADVLIRGEGNIALTDLIDTLGDARPSQGLTAEQRQRLANINGLYFRSKETVIVNNLDKINLIPTDRLRLPDGRYARDIEIYTSFGCPYACPFCHLGTVFDHRVRRIPAEKVVDWLKDLNASTGATKTTINIWDENFLSHKEWVREFVRLVHEAGLNLNPASNVSKNRTVQCKRFNSSS